jgi:hypothetical protein
MLYDLFHLNWYNTRWLKNLLGVYTQREDYSYSQSLSVLLFVTIYAYRMMVSIIKSR